ncbi:unnamed protein product, partial [Porites evermanni]
GQPLKCNSPLILDLERSQCRPPCDWTTQSPLTQKIYYGVVVMGFWLVLIATVITFVTWASIKTLRKFPHVLRFHIMICCILLACCRMIPIRIGLGKTFCREEKYWKLGGHSSFAVKLLGATSHYFSLAHSFWAMCFIVNTYAVIVHERRGVFKHPMKFHFMQSVFSWLGPVGIVLGCLFISPPGYRFVFADLLAAGTDSIQMAYFAFTLPMQLSLGVSLCLLWSIVWCLRKARLDSTKRVIRARDERVSMRRVERQFISMAVVMLLLVGIVLTINTVILYCVGGFIHDSEVYFLCLQTSKDCKSPSYNTVLPLINLVAPGFLCIIFFFLLFMNKDCRQIWKNCFAKFKKPFELCKPPPNRLRAETVRSRCSSTLTVLSERRSSEPYINQKIDPIVLARIQHSNRFSERDVKRFSFGERKPRSSTLSLPARNQTNTLSGRRDTRIEILLTPPPDELDCRPLRTNSVPVFLLHGLESQDTTSIENYSGATTTNSSCVDDASERSIGEELDANGETENFIPKLEECSSKL